MFVLFPDKVYHVYVIYRSGTSCLCYSQIKFAMFMLFTDQVYHVYVIHRTLMLCLLSTDEVCVILFMLFRSGLLCLCYSQITCLLFTLHPAKYQLYLRWAVHYRIWNRQPVIDSMSTNPRRPSTLRVINHVTVSDHPIMSISIGCWGRRITRCTHGGRNGVWLVARKLT